MLNTYRIMGHSKSDAGLYRTREEVEEWKRRDPIALMRASLLKKGLFSEEQLVCMEGKAAKIIEDALAFAEASPEPSLDSIEEDLYA